MIFYGFGTHGIHRNEKPTFGIIWDNMFVIFSKHLTSKSERPSFLVAMGGRFFCILVGHLYSMFQRNLVVKYLHTFDWFLFASSPKKNSLKFAHHLFTIHLHHFWGFSRFHFWGNMFPPRSLRLRPRKKKSFLGTQKESSEPRFSPFFRGVLLLGTSIRWSPYSQTAPEWVDPGILDVGPTKSLTFSTRPKSCHD